MAEPVFEDHPLEEYLRQSGDGVEPMPGGLSDLPLQDEIILDSDSEHGDNLLQLLPPPLAHCLELLLNMLSIPKLATPNREFAERFKYDVISSSLLSSSLSTPVSAKRRSFSPDIRGSLSTLDDLKPKPGADAERPTLTISPEAESNWFAALLLLAVISLAFGFVLPTILFGTTSYYLRTRPSEAQQSDVSEATLQSLQELVSAANIWDSAVNEAISLIEKEERSIYYGPTSPSSPSSPLRVALHSSLHTTQTQSDNVRPLLAALTAEDELTQLSEMYAPPSPVKLSFGLDQHRPMSLPTARTRTTSSMADKRATWNGSYAALAQHGSPSKLILKRSEKRRSDLSALLRSTDRSAVSEPGTPSSTAPLAGVREEDDGKEAHADADEEGEDEDQAPPPVVERGEFGSAALDLRKRRRASGLESLGFSSPTRRASYFAPLGRTNTNSNVASHRNSHGGTNSNASSLSMSMSSSSRFTMMQAQRHPLSLSALTHSLQGALAAKRYAAAHLLALRFDEDLHASEHDAYWDDVRAVMSLLTSALADAAARLLEALEAAAQARLRDQTPSPVPMAMQRAPPAMMLPPRAPPLSASFAPMPSHLSRFATHVDAISGALSDARDELERCVSTLREQPAPESASADAGGAGGERPRTPETMQESPALQAYERLRRELGLALRECERGRERLLDILAPPKGADELDSEPEGAHGDGADEEDDGMPLLGPDAGSDDSDKTDSLRSHLLGAPEGLGDEDAVLVQGAPGALDDAALLLPLAAGVHELPPQGIEQVFEAEVGAGVPFARERSKLTREERIRLVKARRESGGKGLGLGFRFSGDEEREREQEEERRGWGPGGDVVEELKDVIWKVGERRRKMAERRMSEEREKTQESTPPAPPVLSALEESAGLDADAGLELEAS
ncbi:hypothetical protein DENSPDRAFT_682047 [Dentipellis sp. KUC8613]|nr:hypothetical protein DENSPDRAFT_682047 [Dentipellis sp. KUC8613]